MDCLSRPYPGCRPYYSRDLQFTHLPLIHPLYSSPPPSWPRRESELQADKQRARAEFLKKLEQEQQRNAREQAKVDHDRPLLHLLSWHILALTSITYCYLPCPPPGSRRARAATAVAARGEGASSVRAAFDVQGGPSGDGAAHPQTQRPCNRSSNNNNNHNNSSRCWQQQW